MLALSSRAPARIGGPRPQGIVGLRAVTAARTVPKQNKTRQHHITRGLGKDVVDGWLDLAKLVAGDSKSRGAYEELAYKIGRDIYVDISGWHLFLRDMSAVPGLKMAGALAAQLGPMAADAGRSGVREADVSAVLKKIPVDVGGGRVTLSLYDVMPNGCVSDLVRVLGDWARDQ